MRKLNPAWVDKAREVVNGCPYFTLQSMAIEELDAGGTSRIVIEVDRKHLQPFGMVHGGVFSSLVDAAAFWAVYAGLDEELGMTTAEMKLNYLAPTDKGRLIGLGRTIKLGRSLALGEAGITDGEGKLLAHGVGTFMILPDLKLGIEMDWPAKFVSD